MDDARAHDLLDSERRRIESLEAEERGGVAGVDESDEPVAQSLGFLERYEEELSAVDDALRRLEEGTYGICEVCGKPIPDERLEAVPTTRFHAEHEPAPSVG